VHECFFLYWRTLIVLDKGTLNIIWFAATSCERVQVWNSSHRVM